MSPGFRISIVPGVTPGKWVRIWDQRTSRSPVTVTLVDEEAQLDLLRDHAVDMAFVRLPADRDGLHLIPLYSEVPVAVVSTEHPLAVLAEVTLAELADDLLELPHLTAKQAIEVVAGGSGAVVVPMSVARLHHRKDVAAVPVTDVAETQVALVWPEGADDPRIEEFIGVVRGRTARSSRGAPGDDAPPPKRRAADKAAAKAARRQATKGRRPRG